MNHHKTDISGDCMRLVIYWVEDRGSIDVPHLLAKKLHHALEESKKKKIKFSFPGTLQKIIDLYQPSDQTSPLKTYIRRSKKKKPIEEVLEETAVDGVEISFDRVSEDEVNVVRTLRDLHESMNEAEEQGGMDHYMET
jgi:hypothetical protein